MKATALVVCALLLSPLAAAAQDWHIGVGAAGELDQRNGRIGGADIDADNPYTVLGGLSWASGFGVEAAWVDLRDIEASNIADAGFRTDGDLWSLGATFAADTGALQPYAKAGWFWRSEDGSAITIAGPRRIDFDDDGVMAEVGGRWRINDSFALRAGYAWYDFDADSDGSVQVVGEMHFR